MFKYGRACCRKTEETPNFLIRFDEIKKLYSLLFSRFHSVNLCIKYIGNKLTEERIAVNLINSIIFIVCFLDISTRTYFLL